METLVTKVVSEFLGAVTITDIVTLQSGLINSTYKITTNKGIFVLQK